MGFGTTERFMELSNQGVVMLLALLPAYQNQRVIPAGNPILEEPQSS